MSATTAHAAAAPGLPALLRSDYRRYRASGAGRIAPLLEQGLWASAEYRVHHHLRRSVHVPVVRQLVLAAAMVGHKLVEITTGISISPAAQIGQGLYIGHFGNLIVGSAARIGCNCNLSQGVTIGVAGRGDHRGTPVIGDRVYIGPSALLFGGITIGDDVAVGAAAIVTKAVPDRGVVVGNPGRVVDGSGSFDFVLYDGMDADPARLASLAQATRSDT